MVDKQQIINTLEKVREQSPLVHNITNFVAMNNTANALLSIGASPVMAHAKSEVEDMANIASSLVINIGTLNEDWVEGMKLACRAAKSKNTPIILDPVGAGATPYRTKTCLYFIETFKPEIIRGNASEIMSLVNSQTKTKGVDSKESSDSAIDSAKKLALKNNAIVVISGPIDYITDGKNINEIHNGNPIMTKVTAMGCTATAVIGAFAGIKEIKEKKDYFSAATCAMAIMGIAGEIAAKNSKGNGSMQINFLDELCNIGEKEISSYLK